METIETNEVEVRIVKSGAGYSYAVGRTEKGCETCLYV